jgi:hypothetical protein
MHRRPLSLIAFISFSASLASVPAFAADRKVCFSLVDDGQKLRDEGKLREAREAFLTCSDRSCPNAVFAQCTQWLDEVEREIPSIVFRVKDGHGKEVFDAQLFVDAQASATLIQAKSVPQNPGTHSVRVVLSDGKAQEETFLLRKGERDRIIEIAFPVIPEPSAPATRPAATSSGNTDMVKSGFRFPVIAWLGLGVGVLGGVGTAIFATSAKSAETDLQKTGCAPACDKDKRSGIDSKLQLANVSMIVGGVGLGVALVSTIVANVGSSSRVDVKKAESSAPRSFILRIPTIHVTQDGPGAHWSGSF